MIPLIIDCDPGVDDALALLMAAASPEFELLGVTTVAGNRPVEVTAMNACRILDVAGRDDVPVFQGCARPIADARPRCNLVHGEDGLGGVELPLLRKPVAVHAVHFLVDVLRNHPEGSVTLVAVGPLTNLALAEIEQPGILRRARSLAIMGGAAFCPGNVTPSAEFNFYADPLAAEIVMQASANVSLFGLDVTSKATMTRDWIESLAASGSRCGNAARDMLRAYSGHDLLLHDACPVAWLLDATLFSGQPCTVQVHWQPDAAAGHMSTWRAHRTDRPGATNAMVFTDVDASRLLDLIGRRIARLI